MAMKLEMVVLRAPVGSAPATESAGAGRDRELVSNLRPSASARNRALRARAEEISVEVDEMDAGQRARRSADPTVLSIAPRMPVTLIRAFETPRHAAADAPATGWGIEAVGAHDSPFTGEGVTVAVLDTGIDAAHPAFDGVEIVPRNFTADPPEDVDGHGTHCAGTIFGRDVDGRRIGVAKGVKRALIGKVLGDTGGSSEDIVKAIHWAQLEGAEIISMSLGMDFPGYQKILTDKYGMAPEQATSLALAGYRLNTRLFDQLSRAMVGHDGLMTGCLVTAAAGNESRRPDYTIIVAPPATGEMFLSVAALGRNGDGTYRVADFSNEGAAVSAPGEDILSAKRGGGLVAYSGTSMATPHVAGVAALWAQQLKQNGGFSAAGVAERIRSTAKGLGAAFGRDDVGFGLVQAPPAVRPRRVARRRQS
ncbi:S8 family serine peptidase [Mesorhizobium sp. LHD-90]|uniref:S8 family peptidase n=1 Tax=Mesorhizobium sp. LHD-90 TaxID=3071414 RepID=UPI0027E0FB1A|nr:S8 family serine peptidase [Mesorhizobium sp. LHD-90]MDQ6434255.1 S8 family serine peptidase [Mesorhizobium sp. LHD-90]